MSLQYEIQSGNQVYWFVLAEDDTRQETSFFFIVQFAQV